MDKISINDLYEVSSALKHDGYKMVTNQSGKVVFQKGKEIKEIALSDHLDDKPKTMKPDYDNCVLNVIASIKKYYGKKPQYKTNPELDQLLQEKAYKHIAIMVLDGLGSEIISHNLADNSFISSHKMKDLSAVYPSTTACAIPAILSGKEPIETAWCGWSNYFREIDKQVVMFQNVDYFTGDKVDLDVNKLLPYKNFFNSFPLPCFQFNPAFAVDGSKTFAEELTKFTDTIKDLDASFSYIYWDNPDYTMHEHGAYSSQAKDVLLKMDDCIKEMTDKLPEDSLIIITADHGHIDVNPIYLANFTDIIECLSREPSNEGRATFFKVKFLYREKFVRRFKRYFGKYFRLMSKYEFLAKGYLGKNILNLNLRLNSFIGDYVAVATDHYYFNYHPNILTRYEDELPFKSHHAGITVNEMMVPFIVVKK